MKRILTTMLLLLTTMVSQAQITGYNLPHLKHFTVEEIDALVDAVDPGLNYRMYGGEESYGYSYPQDAEFVNKVTYFVSEAQGTMTIVFPRDYEQKGTIQMMKAMESLGVPVKWIQYENEEYYAPEVRWFSRLWWDILFKGSKWYARKLADQHMAESLTLLSDLREAGIDASSRLVYNVPLKVFDNGDYKAYTDQVAKYDHIHTVDVHVYGEQRQRGHESRLRRNLAYITGLDWDVVCFEQYGLWHGGEQRYDLHLKNTDRHKEMHDMTMKALSDHGVTEILHFTLAGCHKTANWNNPPYFNRFQVVEGVAYDLEDQVFSP